MLFEERSDEFIFATQRAVVFAETFSQPSIFFCFFSLFQEKEKNDMLHEQGDSLLCYQTKKRRIKPLFQSCFRMILLKTSCL
jgi:hypothetical protein